MSKRFKIGKITLRKCKRCRSYFLPSHGSQILCPWCQERPIVIGRPIKIKYCVVFGCGKERIPGLGARGLCKEHYNQLIKNPRSLKRKRLKAAEKWKEEGMQICKFFEECEVYFIPRARNQHGVQKYCTTCARKQHKLKDAGTKIRKS